VKAVACGRIAAESDSVRQIDPSFVSMMKRIGAGIVNSRNFERPDNRLSVGLRAMRSLSPTIGAIRP
jgi:hypothetical protein